MTTSNPPGEGGIFVARWTTLRIPPGGFRITMTERGPEAAVRAEVSMEMWPHWLQLGVGHLKAAKTAHTELLDNDRRVDPSRTDAALNNEYQAAMQVITSAAFSLDALYAVLDERVAIPEATRKAWSEKRTARAKRFAEVLRLATRIPQAEFVTLRESVVTLFKLRDQSVHPDSTFREPVLHPDLNVGVDRRFVNFGVSNAEGALNCALEALMNSFRRSTLLSDIDKAWVSGQGEILDQLLIDNGVTVRHNIS